MFDDRWDPDPVASGALIAVILAIIIALLVAAFEAITGIKIKSCC
jgi:hypothetical protein